MKITQRIRHLTRPQNRLRLANELRLLHHAAGGRLRLLGPDDGHARYRVLSTDPAIVILSHWFTRDLRLGVERDFSAEWEQLFTNELIRYQPLANAPFAVRPSR